MHAGPVDGPEPLRLRRERQFCWRWAQWRSYFQMIEGVQKARRMLSRASLIALIARC